MATQVGASFFLQRDADGDSHWYDYQANAKYATSCYSSHLTGRAPWLSFPHLFGHLQAAACPRLPVLFQSIRLSLSFFFSLKQKQSQIIWITHWQSPAVGLLETIWTSPYYWLNYHIVSNNYNWQHIQQKISFSAIQNISFIIKEMRKLWSLPQTAISYRFSLA